jgi:hypothetical protein
MTTDQTKTAADLMNEVGPKLAGHDEWIPRLAETGIAQKETLRGLRRGHANFGPDHPFFVSLLAYAERRAKETKEARDAIKSWMKANRAAPVRKRKPSADKI